MGSIHTKLVEDTSYSNKVILMTHYNYNDYTPARYNGENKTFVSRIREITPETILFLYRPITSAGPYWWILEQHYYKNIKINGEIRTLENKDYNYLVIPRGISCYAGVVREDSTELKGDTQQIYLPTVIYESLEPFSNKFKARPKSRKSEIKYINGINIVLKVQSNFKEEYNKSLKEHTSNIMVDNLDKELNRIYSLTNKGYNNLNLQNLVLEIDIFREKLLIASGILTGPQKEEINTIVLELFKFQELVVSNISTNTKWGNNFADILEICKIRDNPKLGNMFDDCDEDFKKVFMYREVPTNIENSEHIIHRRYDGYVIKVKIYRDYGANNYVLEFYD